MPIKPFALRATALLAGRLFFAALIWLIPVTPSPAQGVAALGSTVRSAPAASSRERAIEQTQSQASDKRAGRLVDGSGERQSETSRSATSTRLPNDAPQLLGGLVLVMALLYAIRKRMMNSSASRAGSARLGNWLLTMSIAVLAVAGLGTLCGSHVLVPLIGPEPFALLIMLGRLVHTYAGVAFMAGLLLAFLGRQPDFRSALHWSSLSAGVVLALSGLALLFPFELRFYELLTSSAVVPSVAEELQIERTWHGLAALTLLAFIVVRAAAAGFGKLAADRDALRLDLHRTSGQDS